MAKNDIFTGGGRLYFAKKNGDGSYDNLMYFGKTDGITMTTSVEFKEHFDTEGCTPLLDGRYPSQFATGVKFSTSEITLDMQNRAFLGNVVTTTQTTATGDAIVIPTEEVVEGSIVETGKYNATLLVVKDSGDITTYVEGTDYEFDAKVGFITIIPTADGGTITTGDVLNLTMVYPDFTINTSATMKNSSLNGRFEVVTSSQTGNNYRYVFKNLSITQDGDFSIKSPDEIGSLSFAGSALVDSTANNGSLSDYMDIIELDSTDC